MSISSGGLGEAGAMAGPPGMAGGRIGSALKFLSLTVALVLGSMNSTLAAMPLPLASFILPVNLTSLRVPNWIISPGSSPTISLKVSFCQPWTISVTVLSLTDAS